MPPNRSTQKLHNFLQGYTEGQIVRQHDLQKVMNWTKKTVKTYEPKNMLSPFLCRIDADTFRALRNGEDITIEEVNKYFSQSKPKKVALVRGAILHGEIYNYVLDEQLGAGAVGQVWSAEGNGYKYAVKVMQPREDLLEASTITNIRDRFRREARNAMKLSHKHFVKYIDHGKFDDAPFVVMELAKESLAQALDRNGPYSVSDSLAIIRDCVEGLS